MRSIWSVACCVWLVLFLGLSPACLAQASLPLGELAGDEERLEGALAQRGSLDAVELPLSEVVDKLSAQFRVPIVLQPKKLEEAGVSVDTPIHKRLEGMPLESILDLILDELDLDFTIRNHVILISTPEDLESPEMMDMRIYPVRDLVAYRVPGTKDDPHRYAADYDSLIEVITTTIAPESWVDVGGPGSIKEFDNSAALVISQTRRIHREVTQLLATLRRVKETQVITSLPLGKAKAASSRIGTSHIAGRAAPNPPRRIAATPPQSWQVPQVHEETVGLPAAAQSRTSRAND